MWERQCHCATVCAVDDRSDRRGSGRWAIEAGTDTEASGFISRPAPLSAATLAKLAEAPVSVMGRSGLLFCWRQAQTTRASICGRFATGNLPRTFSHGIGYPKAQAELSQRRFATISEAMQQITGA